MINDEISSKIINLMLVLFMMGGTLLVILSLWYDGYKGDRLAYMGIMITFFSLVLLEIRDIKEMITELKQ